MKFLQSIGWLSLLGSSAVHALPGLSPVWERLYNNNEPFSETNPSHAPTADPDGDGWNNLRESIAGTNPFSGTPGEGFLQAACSIAPWPADSFRIEWPSQIGKNYQLSHSPDLITWTTDPTSMPGSGNPLWMHVSPAYTDGTLPERLFWRVVVSDFTAPGSSYSPYELHLLATHPDLAGAISGTGGGSGTNGNPTDPDSDGAGPTDSKDASPNDNTINWHKTPEAKYLWIPAEAAPGFVAVDANDRGQILFHRTVPVQNYATDPVAKIWDPSRSENDRFIDILFQPSEFAISLWKSNNPGAHYPGEEDPVTVETAPIPTVPPDPNRSIYINVEPRFIGPDGSVMANVTYSLYEFEGASEKQTRQANGQFVFLWKGQSYNTCRILGENPGYQGNIITEKHHFAAGFYTDTAGSEPVVRALFSEQPIHLQDIYLTGNLIICAQSVEPDGDIRTLAGEPSRNQNVYPNPRATPSGRVLITNTVDAGNLRRTVCGIGGRYPIPVNTISDTLSDIPAQPGGATCGLGNSNGPFQLFNNGALTRTATDGVIQFDKTGTGISRGRRANQHIWRNARWMSLREAAGLAAGDAALNDYVPKKITEAGIIWVGNQEATSNGILVPVAAILHERGTINNPGDPLPYPVDPLDAYEVVTLENADYDEYEAWVPNSMQSASENFRQDALSSTVNVNRDDDFVKLHLHCPPVNGSLEMEMLQPGVNPRMMQSDLRFYDRIGNGIPLGAINIPDLAEPSGPAAGLVKPEGLDVFIEISDLGQTTQVLAEANRNVRRYADLIIRLRLGSIQYEQLVRIYRGGYWKNIRSGNSGTIALYDGKGRYQNRQGNWTVGSGELVHGPLSIQSGQPGTTDATISGRGPTPVGWYGLYERLDFRRTWLQINGRWNRPQLNHDSDQNGNALGYLQQGSYCQWRTGGNRAAISSHGAYQYEGVSAPDSIHFKFELVRTSSFTNRTELQIHPDGFNDGTAGCVGLQTYADCCKMFFLTRHYWGSAIQVTE